MLLYITLPLLFLPLPHLPFPFPFPFFPFPHLTVTRAKSALIVIGDSRTLKNERHWRAFVEWCKAEDCYVSSPLKPEVLATLYASARPPAPYIPAVARTRRDNFKVRNDTEDQSENGNEFDNENENENEKRFENDRDRKVGNG